MKKVLAAIVCFALCLTMLCGCSINISDKNISFGINGSRYTYDNADKYTASSDFSVDLSVQSIADIELDWITGDITVKVTDGDKIHVSETGASNDDDMMRYCVENGVLDIKWRAKGRYDSGLKKSLAVEIPRSLTSAIDFDAALVSADTTITGCKFNKLSVSAVSGSVDISECVANKLDVDNVSGRITINGEISEADFDTVSGDITLRTTVSIKEISVDSVSGDFSLSTIEKPKKISVETISGHISCYGEDVHSGREFDKENTDGVGKVEVETVSGDISLSIE